MGTIFLKSLPFSLSPLEPSSLRVQQGACSLTGFPPINILQPTGNQTPTLTGFGLMCLFLLYYYYWFLSQWLDASDADYYIKAARFLFPADSQQISLNQAP